MAQLKNIIISKVKKFDVITLMWTLCNTSNCLDIIKISNKLLKKNGYIVCRK